MEAEAKHASQSSFERRGRSGVAEGTDAIISIRGPTDAAGTELAVAFAQATGNESARLLRLSFDDIGIAQQGDLTGPSMAQITDAIEFGRSVADGQSFYDGSLGREATIPVHCEQEKWLSRHCSCTVADHFGNGREQDAVNALLRNDIENRMHPNPLIISLMDACLFRYGRIDAALAELSPEYARWRALWRDRAANPGRYRIVVRRARSKRGGKADYGVEPQGDALPIHTALNLGFIQSRFRVGW